MTSSNCLASTSIGCIFCCHGCRADLLRNAFTFLPPSTSYDVKDGKIIYFSEGLRHHPSYQLAAECSSVHMLKTGSEESIPMVWIPSPGGEVPPTPGVASSRVPVSASETESEMGAHSSYQATNCENSCFGQPSLEKVGQPSLKKEDMEQQARIADGNQKQNSRDNKQDLRFVLLHFHGNATDIGMMMASYCELSKQLGVDVVGVEYSGYGVSTGSPSPRNTLLDAEAAYDHLVNSGVLPERIVAYGQSVGCGPALALASRRPLGGLVLHSPMLSGIKVIDPEPNSFCKPSCVFNCFDFFPNEQAIKLTTCPTFVIHGQLDNIIPVYHGIRLSDVAPKERRWPGYFPKNAGHNDIVEQDAGQYFERVRAFIRSVMDHSEPVGYSKVTRKPAQVAMSDGPQTATVLFSEPVVGPADGRYQKLRHNEFKVRELSGL